ncbi:MAG TPA: hypothetical protein P5120_18450, partial [Spirochaetota bacterium]|nr:hypothetical protein [Spirochaetota bacterium]
KDSGISSYKELLSLWNKLRQLHTDASESAFMDQADKFYGNEALYEKIEAQSVVIEVIDRNTGKIFRREIPLDYLETDNGIILSGENSNGAPSTIAFLSDTALHRINDLRGKGPDEHTCDH